MYFSSFPDYLRGIFIIYFILRVNKIKLTIYTKNKNNSILFEIRRKQRREIETLEASPTEITLSELSKIQTFSRKKIYFKNNLTTDSNPREVP